MYILLPYFYPARIILIFILQGAYMSSLFPGPLPGWEASREGQAPPLFTTSPCSHLCPSQLPVHPHHHVP